MLLLPSGDGVFVSRVVGSVEYGRPLGTGWQGTLGLSWQRAKCVDEHSQVSNRERQAPARPRVYDRHLPCSHWSTTATAGR